MDNSSSQQVKELTDGWRHKLSGFFSIILMLQIALFASAVVSEIAARESVLSVLTGRIATLKSEFVEQNRTEINISAESTLSDRVSKEKTDYRERLLHEIEFYEALKRSLIFFIAQGSNHSALSLRAIQEMELRHVSRRMKQIGVVLFDGGEVRGFSEFYVPDLLSSSDQLLAFAVMACAAIGAMIAALRGNGLMTLRALALGIATGFVVYLAIKGGKHVFLLQMQTEIVAFNPYGSAFAGLLAGMFTEKAYQIINTFVDEVANRLHAVSTGKKIGD